MQRLFPVVQNVAISNIEYGKTADLLDEIKISNALKS